MEHISTKCQRLWGWLLSAFVLICDDCITTAARVPFHFTFWRVCGVCVYRCLRLDLFPSFFLLRREWSGVRSVMFGSLYECIYIYIYVFSLWCILLSWPTFSPRKTSYMNFCSVLFFDILLVKVPTFNYLTAFSFSTCFFVSACVNYGWYRFPGEKRKGGGTWLCSLGCVWTAGGFSSCTLTPSAPCLQDDDSVCHVPAPSLPASWRHDSFWNAGCLLMRELSRCWLEKGLMPPLPSPHVSLSIMAQWHR